jgi:hypothetical protein
LDMGQHLRLVREILAQGPAVSLFAVDSDSIFSIDVSYRGPSTIDPFCYLGHR